MKHDSTASQMSDAFRWAIEDAGNSAMASADWLARDIDPDVETAVDLLSKTDQTLARYRQAKDAYKTMRIVGETSADRRIAARLYAGAIAGAIVRHNKRISSQSDAALTRGLTALKHDTRMPISLRDLATSALRALEKGGR